MYIYITRGLKFNADKRMVMVLGGEEGLVCKIILDDVRDNCSRPMSFSLC